VIAIHKTSYRKKDISIVLKDQTIEMEYYPEDEVGKTRIKNKKIIKLAVFLNNYNLVGVWSAFQN